MVITVIGAGTIGSAVVHALHKHPDVSQIRVCDTRPGTLEALQEAVSDHKIRTHEVDARNLSALRPLLHNAKVLVNCIASEMSPLLAQLAIEGGLHFCDLGGYVSSTQAVIQMHDQAEKSGVWLLPNCGLAPGLVNILMMDGIQQFDEVEDCLLRVGTVPHHPNPPLNFASFFSAEKLIEEYTEPTSEIIDGEYRTAEPLTGITTIEVGEPFGVMESFYASGVLGETAPKLVGKVRNLNFKAIRYPNHASQMSFMLALGFAEKRLVDVGTHLTYRDILARRIRQRLSGSPDDAVLLRVLINGRVNGQDKALLYEMTEIHNDGDDMTAVKRCIGASVGILAAMLANGEVEGTGASTPEFVIPTKRFLEQLRMYGLEPRIRWFDKHLDINHLPA